VNAEDILRDIETKAECAAERGGPWEWLGLGLGSQGAHRGAL